MALLFVLLSRSECARKHLLFIGVDHNFLEKCEFVRIFSLDNCGNGCVFGLEKYGALCWKELNELALALRF